MELIMLAAVLNTLASNGSYIMWTVHQENNNATGFISKLASVHLGVRFTSPCGHVHWSPSLEKLVLARSLQNSRGIHEAQTEGRTENIFSIKIAQQPDFAE